MGWWAGAGQPGRAAAAGLDGAGGADAPDPDAVPELLPAVRADSADALAHAWAGLCPVANAMIME